jgi:hypothetical protein
VFFLLPTIDVYTKKMAFRKTVKKILSKLQHGKRDKSPGGSPKDKQVPSRPSTASTAETVRPPGANVYQHPKTPPTPIKPSFQRAESEFPEIVDQDYRPSDVISESAPAIVEGRDTLRRERYDDDDNDLYEPPRRPERLQPLLDRKELSRSVDEASAKAFQLHDEEHAFPESLLEPGDPAARIMSNMTTDTQASSDYDQHCLFPPQFCLVRN